MPQYQNNKNKIRGFPAADKEEKKRKFTQAEKTAKMEDHPEIDLKPEADKNQQQKEDLE